MVDPLVKFEGLLFSPCCFNISLGKKWYPFVNQRNSKPIGSFYKNLFKPDFLENAQKPSCNGLRKCSGECQFSSLFCSFRVTGETVIYDQTILCGYFLLQRISGLPCNPLGSSGLSYSPFFVHTMLLIL